MFEHGFLRFIRLTNHFQANQFPQIIQYAIKGFNSPFVSIICWSTLPKWERDNWMNVQPSKHLILINGQTHQGPWFEGNSQLSIADPFTLCRMLEKLLMLLRIYGKIIISWVAGIEFLSLALDHILMLLLI